MESPDKHIATIRITDLHLRTIVGIHDWEKTNKQDVIINITMQYNATKAIETDAIEHVVDYKAITKKIIQSVEPSSFLLLEKLADTVLRIVMEDKNVLKASARVDKPQALRFAKSVSIELSASNEK